MTASNIPLSVEALAWALIHFLWQGAALGVMVFLWLRLGRPSAQARYVGGVLALAALLAAPVGTFLWLGTGSDRPSSSGMTSLLEARDPAIDLATETPGPLPVPATRADASDAGVTAREVAVAAVVMGWAAGVLLLSLRLAGGWILARRLAARAARPATAQVSALAAGVSVRLGLTRAVRVIESAAVTVPMLVGWMKPVVLLPASALSGLSAEQIEALIAHELAHVRRHDYIVNILQSIVETLLFYHPAVWFVSRQVRQAREECCDDLAVGVCDRVVYVRALADLAGLAQAPRSALAATDGYLLRRVQRLLGQPQTDRGPGAAWLAVLSMALLVGGVMPTALGSSGGEPIDAPQAAVGGVAGQAEGVGVGVAARMAGGIAAGVAGGVEGGVTGGVAGGQGEQRRRTEEEARRMRQEADRQLRQAARSPGDLRELEARALRARAKLDAARTEHDGVKQLFDVGLLSASGIQESRNRLAAAERELAAVAVEIQATAEDAAVRDRIDMRRARMQTESQMRQVELELRTAQRAYEALRERVKVGTASRDALLEAEAVMLAGEQRLLAAQLEFELAQEEAAVRQQRTNALQRLAQELAAMDVRNALHSAGALAATSAVTDPDERVRSSDVVAIEIAGEPHLPRTYSVDAKGTIRLPLVGSIQVTGLTAAEVRDAVLALLGQRQLAEGKQVSVTLHRQK